MTCRAGSPARAAPVLAASPAASGRTAGHWWRAGSLLGALAAALAGAASACSAQELGSSERIRRELDEILAQPDFRRLDLEPELPRVSTDWLDDFARWLQDRLKLPAVSAGWMGDLLRGIAWVFIAAVGCLVIWLLVRAVNNYRARAAERLARTLRPDEGEANSPPGDVPADEYLRRAEGFRQQGQFREAVAQLILGAMSTTERDGLIRFRRGFTHRDYLRALRGQPIPYQAFRALVQIYEPIGFGRRPSTREHYQTARTAYEEGFSAPLRPAV